MAGSAVAFAGYLLPAHRREHDEHFHSNFADGGAIPLVVLAAAFVLAALLRTKKIGAGMIAGVLSFGAAIGAVIPVVLVHLFESMRWGIGENIYATGIGTLFFGGALFVVLEPALYLLQRRSDERLAVVAPARAYS